MKNIILRSITLILLSICALTSVAVSAYAAKDFNIKNNTQNYFHVDGASGNIGLGTTSPQGAFVVTSGNVGIGTWAPISLLQVGKYVSSVSGLSVDTNGNIGIGTTTPQESLVILKGNVGIGTLSPDYRFKIVDNSGGAHYGANVVHTSPGGSYGAAIWALENGGAFNNYAVYGEAGQSGVGVMGYATGQNGYSGIGVQGQTEGTGVSTGVYAFNNGTSNAGYALHAVNNSTTGWSVYADGTSPNYFAGNIGIGTIRPSSALKIVGGVGIGTGPNTTYVTTAAPSGGMIVQGNVGIGSTAPGAALDINGTQRIIASGGDGTGLNIINPSSMISIQLGATGSNTWYMGASTSANSVGAGKLFFSRSSTTSASDAVFDGSGNFGVGTITPQARLTVLGGNVGIGTWTAANASLETTGLRLIGNGAAAGSVLVSSSTGIGTWMAPGTISSSAASGWSTGTGTVYNTTGSDNVGVGTTTPQGGFVVTNGNVGIGTWAPQALLDVYGAGDAYFTTNVGIGSVNPTQALDVVGTGKFSVAVNAPAISNLTSNGFVKTSGGTGTLSVDTNTYPSYSSMTTNYLQKATSSSAVGNSSIFDNGNVGIGTSTPQGGLVVTNGNVGIGTWAPDTALSVRLGNVGIGTGASHSRFEVTGDGAQELLRINDSGPNDISPFLITSSGNVGIGTTTASVLASVYGAAPAGVGFTGSSLISVYNTNTGSNNVSMSMDSANGQGHWLVLKRGGTVLGALSSDNSWFNVQAGAVPMVFNVNSGEAMRITTGRNIGVGTTTPQAKLSIIDGNVGIGTWTADTARLETTGLRLIGNGAAAGSVLVSTSTGIGTWMAASTLATSGGGTPGGSSSQLQYNNGGSFGGIVNSNVTASGNMGLGTTLSTNKLDVSGGVGIGSTYAGYRNAAGNGLIVQGNVGVGTYVPSANLSIRSAAASNDLLEVQNTSGLQIFKVRSSFDWGTMSLNDSSGTPIVEMYANLNSGPFIRSWASSKNKPDGEAWDDGAGLSIAVANVIGNENGIFFINSPTGAMPGAAITHYISDDSNYGRGGLKFKTSDSGSATTRMVIDPVGQVGIGTTTPQARLSIIGGNVGIGTLTAANASLETTGLRLIGNGAAAGSVLVSSSTGIGTWMAASTLATSGAASGWSTGTGTVYNTTGSDNIGIGTTTPQGGLVVTNGNVGIGTWAPAGVFQVGSPTSAPFIVDANGGVGIGTVLTSNAGLTVMNGFVGIGTWKPGVALQVGRANRSVSGAPDQLYFGTYGGPGSGGFPQMIGNWVSTAAWGIGPATSNSDSTLQIGATTGSVPPTFAWSTANKTNFLLTGNIGINTFTMSSESALYVGGGNVALGTSSPQAVLSIVGNVGVGTVKNGDRFLTTSPPAGGMIIEGNVGIGTHTPQDKFIVVGGNVGIGTWSAANASLETTGLRLIGNNAAAGSVLVSSSTGIGTWMAASTLATGAAASGWSTGTGTVYNTTGSDKVGIGTTTPQGGLVITNGNVGIGTFAPTQLLDINGNIAASGTGDSYFLGSVGIGSSSPATALDVTGTVRSTAISAGSGGFTVDSSGNVTAVASTTTTGGYTQSGTSANTFTGTSTFSNATRSAIFTGGNVGVGTTTPQGGFVVTNGNLGIGTWSPGSKLEINGFGTTQPSLTVNAGAQQSSSTYPVQIKGSYNGLGFNALYLENSGTATGTNVSVQFGNGANGAVAGIAGVKTSDAYGALQFLTADTVGYSERMRITASGSVGIGTNTPQGGFVVTNGNVGIGTWAPNSTFTFKGSQSASLTTVTVDTTLGASQYTVLVDSTSSAITITLPTAVGITGRCYRIKDWKGQSAVNNINIATTSGQTIDGAASAVMNVAYQGAEFCSDGANWSIF